MSQKKLHCSDRIVFPSNNSYKVVSICTYLTFQYCSFIEFSFGWFLSQSKDIYKTTMKPAFFHALNPTTSKTNPGENDKSSVLKTMQMWLLLVYRVLASFGMLDYVNFQNLLTTPVHVEAFENWEIVLLWHLKINKQWQHC